MIYTSTFVISKTCFSLSFYLGTKKKKEKEKKARNIGRNNNSKGEYLKPAKDLKDYVNCEVFGNSL